ncbi:hypothetical protein BGZ68_000881 [Mortierella alpina]|nr:hypothetical protein BGZ68_000881 [Mortierella alpina]
MALSSPALSSFLHALEPYWEEFYAEPSAIDLTELKLPSELPNTGGRRSPMASRKGRFEHEPRKKDQGIHHTDQLCDPTDEMDTWEAHWDTEALKMLLGITEWDIEQLYQEEGSTVDAFVAIEDHSQSVEPLNDGAVRAVPSMDQSPSPCAASDGAVQRTNAMETFVHPGFYTLPSGAHNQSGRLDNDAFPSLSASASASTASANVAALPMANKRPWREQDAVSDANEAVLRHKRTDSRSKTFHLAQSPLLYATEMRRHSVDVPPSGVSTPPYAWAYSTPPKTPSLPSSLFQDLIFTDQPHPHQQAPQLQQQQQQQQQQQMHQRRHFADLPPGQPFVAATGPPPPLIATQSPPFLTRHQHLQETPPYGTPRRQAPRKRRASKFSVPASYEQRQALSRPTNAVPPPLQQQHAPARGVSPFSLYSTLPEHLTPQLLQTPQPAPQESKELYSVVKNQPPTSVPALHDQKLSHRGVSYRRNPGEVPASTLPPDHFIFQEAFLKMNRLHSNVNNNVNNSSSNSNSTGQIVGGTTSPIQDKDKTGAVPEGLGLPHHAHLPPEGMGKQGPGPGPSTETGVGLRRESLSRPESPFTSSLSSSTGPSSSSPSPLSSAVPSLAHVKGSRESSTDSEQALSAAAVFARSLTTVSTLDPAATKLVSQLRLQESLCGPLDP